MINSSFYYKVMVYLIDIDIVTLWPYNWPKSVPTVVRKTPFEFDGFLKYLPSECYSICTSIVYLIIFHVFYSNNAKLFFWLHTTSMSDFKYFRLSKKCTKDTVWILTDFFGIYHPNITIYIFGIPNHFSGILSKQPKVILLTTL